MMLKTYNICDQNNSYEITINDFQVRKVKETFLISFTFLTPNKVTPTAMNNSLETEITLFSSYCKDSVTFASTI